MNEPVQPAPEPLEGVKARDSGEAEVDLDHDPDEHQPPQTWIHPEKCPLDGEDLTVVSESFTYRCSSHIWKKEQFVTGDLAEPWARIGL